MNADELKDQLGHFTGTGYYSRFYPRVFLTDGANFLADHAKAWWLLDVYVSYLLHLDGDAEPFTCLKLNVSENSAMVVIEDGNDHLIAKQHIAYTDIPLSSITLYACWNEDGWVLMLPSEY
jgi:hypothetical protein